MSDYTDLVVDGGYLIWRSAYACASQGGEVGDRFLESCLLWCRLNGARALRVCWDAGREGRRAIFPGYKVGGGSDGAPPEVRDSVDRAREGLDRVLPLLGAERYRAPGWEADDLCATLALRLSSAGGRVLVASGDKDLLQLVRRGVHVIRPSRKRGEPPVVVHLANWEETSGVPPVPDPLRAWLAVQSLWGDPGDMVPGVSGIGEVRAKAVVRAYPDALERLGRPGAFPSLAPGLRALLEAPAALLEAALSHELVRLRSDLDAVPLDGPPRDARAARSLLRDLGWDGCLEAGDPDDLRVRRDPPPDRPGRRSR